LPVPNGGIVVVGIFLIDFYKMKDESWWEKEEGWGELLAGWRIAGLR
jgi:hypothetical protein